MLFRDPVPLTNHSYCHIFFHLKVSKIRKCKQSCTFNILQILCMLSFCRQFVSYTILTGFPVIFVFADGCQLPDDAGLSVTSIFAGGLPTTRSCWAPWHLRVHVFADSCQLPMQGSLSPLSIFAGGLPTIRSYQGSLASVYLKTVTNYPMMQGPLSPLYLQAVCQLPGRAGLPGICVYMNLQTVASYLMMQGSWSPLNLHAVCKLLGGTRAPWHLCICRR
jgi:hypothetical protein